jgi:hypothetical protein
MMALETHVGLVRACSTRTGSIAAFVDNITRLAPTRLLPFARLPLASRALIIVASFGSPKGHAELYYGIVGQVTRRFIALLTSQA